MRRSLFVALFFLFTSLAFAQPPKPPEKKEGPRPLLCMPLGVVPGVETKLVIRGQRLDDATELRFGDVKAAVKILKKSKVGVPDKQDVNKIGDTQLEIQVTLPADFAGKEAAFTIVTPAGESPPHALLVDKTPTIPEKEPNNGFRQAQPIVVPQVIDGAIATVQDVDVFRFEGRAGQQLVVDVLAARHGSALDSYLTLYNGDGQILASNDDSGGSTDSHLEAKLPAAGAYYVSVSDANDTAGPTHVYRLIVR